MKPLNPPGATIELKYPVKDAEEPRVSFPQAPSSVVALDVMHLAGKLVTDGADLHRQVIAELDTTIDKTDGKRKLLTEMSPTLKAELLAMSNELMADITGQQTFVAAQRKATEEAAHMLTAGDDSRIAQATTDATAFVASYAAAAAKLAEQNHHLKIT